MTYVLFWFQNVHSVFHPTGEKLLLCVFVEGPGGFLWADRQMHITATFSLSLSPELNPYPCPGLPAAWWITKGTSHILGT